jgi:hypothetical protein
MAEAGAASSDLPAGEARIQEAEAHKAAANELFKGGKGLRRLLPPARRREGWPISRARLLLLPAPLGRQSSTTAAPCVPRSQALCSRRGRLQQGH